MTLRIEKAFVQLDQKYAQRKMEYLEQAAQNRQIQEKPAKIQLSEADRQKLKEAYRRAADRRAPRDRDRDKGREDR